MLLPAKLSFMANSLHMHQQKLNSNLRIPLLQSASKNCVHGIREYGERSLLAADNINSETECLTLPKGSFNNISLIC